MGYSNPLQPLLGMFQPQTPDPYQSLLGDNYDKKRAMLAWLGGNLTGVGMGLASGRPGAWAVGGLQGGQQAMDDYRQRAAVMYGIQQRKEDRDYQRQQDEEAAAARHEQEAAQAAAIASMPPAMRTIAQAYPSAVIGKYVDQKFFPDPQGGGGANNWGMQVVPLRDKQTQKIVAGQLNQSQGGIFVNGQPADPNRYEFDPGGLAQDRSQGTTVGKAVGGAQAELPGAISAAGVTKMQIQDVLNDPDLPSVIGWNSYRPDFTASNKMISLRSKIQQLMGQSFLQARQLLKGGGPITDYEGGKADEAYNRMKIAIQSGNVEDFKSALTDFNAMVDSGVAKLQATAGGGAPASPASSGGEEQWTIGPDGKPMKVQ